MSAKVHDRKSIRLGLIGSGNIWRQVYLPAVAGFGDRVEMISVCDVSSRAVEAALAQLPSAHGYDDPREMFRNEVMDAVLVLTAEKANAAMALVALRAGVPVFQEKPPAMSVAEWRELMAATESGGRLYTGFNRRHTPLFRGWRFPEGARMQSVRGALLRQGRV